MESEFRTTDDAVTECARKAFGVSYLYPWQRLVIANILDAAAEITDVDALSPGAETRCSSEMQKTAAAEMPTAEADRLPSAPSSTASRHLADTEPRGHQIVPLPTGAGKSLCFQIPALFLHGPTLVIYPLLALMSDQKRRIDESGLTSVVFRGGQSVAEREDNFKKIASGAHIIIANPEVLQDAQLVQQLAACHIAHIAIDEAHCVSEWGDSFRPAYRSLGTVIKTLAVPVVTAFTATASPPVLARVADILFDGNAHIVRSESDRPNIHYSVVYAAAKQEAALRLVHTERRPIIIFCGTRNRAEDMARAIRMCYGAERARFYHAGLDRDEKTRIEEWFFAQTDAVLCATCAYGMGVDKKDIRTVIHIDPPATAEAYIQEAGRGGRDGSRAHAILLWSMTDSIWFSRYAAGSREAAMRQFAESTDCRRRTLLNALGAPDVTGEEQVVCSGCDICDGRAGHPPSVSSPAPPPLTDGKIAYDFIRAHQKRYRQNNIEGLLVDELNNKLPLLGKLRIWTHETAADITEQLMRAGIVTSCGFPWRGELTAISRKKLTGVIPQLFRLHSVQPPTRQQMWHRAAVVRLYGAYERIRVSFFDSWRHRHQSSNTG
ncbi:MAG: ATP-dependent DNA helicase RecQ [Treponema sp.]|nr:ATP-dependent DNA helicase RecQ [Treponema sp.]